MSYSLCAVQLDLIVMTAYLPGYRTLFLLKLLADTPTQVSHESHCVIIVHAYLVYTDNIDHSFVALAALAAVCLQFLM